MILDLTYDCLENTHTFFMRFSDISKWGNFNGTSFGLVDLLCLNANWKLYKNKFLIDLFYAF